MILADKIIINRKRLNLTQEALAEEINVSRQAVSKWEGAQSIPEMEKIILLSNLFGVSVDYLIRDEIEDIEYLDSEQFSKTKRLSVEEVNTFLEKSMRSSSYVSLGVMLCILSPVMLILLTSLSSLNMINLSETGSSSIGITILLILVSIGVGLFIINSYLMKEYEFLEKEYFELNYGVEGIVKQKQKLRKKENIVNITTGVILLILSPLPVIISQSFTSQFFSDVYAVPLLLLTVSIGTYIIIRNGIRENSYFKLLQEQDYTMEKKRRSKIYGKISAIYWLSITTIFLAYSFVYNGWHNSWMIWPISGVLFTVIMAIVSVLLKEDEDN